MNAGYVFKAGQPVDYKGTSGTPERWTVVGVAESQVRDTQDLGYYEVDFYECVDQDGGRHIINGNNLRHVTTQRTIEVNGITVTISDIVGVEGAGWATYQTEYSPNGSIHDAIAAAIGVNEWQVQGIGAQPGWGMNARGSANWSLAFATDVETLETI